jgi:plastocyanin
MSKSALTVLSVVIVLVVTLACGSAAPAAPPETAPTISAPATAVLSTPVPPPLPTQPAPTPTPTVPPVEVVEVTLGDPAGSGRYEFIPDSFEFETGETVIFRLTSQNESHSFRIDALDVHQEIAAGETIDVIVTFDEPGTYDFQCLAHAVLGMVGTITVE